MIVYRVSKREEIDRLFSEYDFSNLGHKFENGLLNNHNYEKDALYLHFFSDKDSILYLDISYGDYICTFDIPDSILEKYKGIGLYLDLFKFYGWREIVEYAIKNTEIRFEYLVSVQEIQNFTYCDDSLDNDCFSYFGNVIYNKDDVKKLGRKY